MLEEKETWFTATLVLIVLIIVGVVSGGIPFLLRYSVSDDLSESAYPDSSRSSRPIQDNALKVLEASEVDFSRVDISAAADENLGKLDAAPTGVFNYGGSTTWASLREKEALFLKVVWSDFQIR